MKASPYINTCLSKDIVVILWSARYVYFGRYCPMRTAHRCCHHSPTLHPGWSKFQVDSTPSYPTPAKVLRLAPVATRNCRAGLANGSLVLPTAHRLPVCCRRLSLYLYLSTCYPLPAPTSATPLNWRATLSRGRSHFLRRAFICKLFRCLALWKQYGKHFL